MKKFLSLVLALVMAMSLVTISAGATEYKDLTDKDEIQYEEAVAVLNRIGVITGYDDGSFRPTTELTRGAAAKIIVSLLIGPEAASNLPNTNAPYPDVPAGHTFAGVISFCKTKGIISGYGDGTFKPANTLTGYAFAKMLLGAVGYDANLERFVDTGWTMNVAAVGQSAGLFDRLVFDGSAAVTREQACQLALNALKATVVQYSQGINVNVTGDNTNVVVSGGQTRSYKTSNQEFARNIRTRQGNSLNSGGLVNQLATDYYTVEFAEEHFVDLRLEHDKWNPTHDDFGRPSSEWSYKKVTIGTYPLEADFEFTTQTAHLEATDAAKDRATGLRDYDLYSDNDATTTLWWNGVEDTTTLDPGADRKQATTADISDLTDNGTLVQVYVSNNDADFITDVVVIQTQLMEIDKVGSDYVSLKRVEPDTVKEQYGYNQLAIHVDVENVREDDEAFAVLKDLKSGDKVAIVPVAQDKDKVDYRVGRAYVPETVSGQLTKATTYGAVGKGPNAIDLTVGGTDYKIANWNDKMIDLDANTIKITKKDVTLTLDEYGNAMLAKNIGEDSEYMVVSSFGLANQNGKLVHTVNGFTVGGEAVSLNVGYTDYNDGVNHHVAVGDLVKYTSNTSSSTAEWKILEGDPDGSGETPANTDDDGAHIFEVLNNGTYEILARNVGVRLEDGTPVTGGNYYFANDVKFIYVTFSDDYDEVESIEIISGVQNVSATEIAQDNGITDANSAQAYTDDDYVKAVVIKQESNNANLANSGYIIARLGTVGIDSEGNKYQGYRVAWNNPDGKWEEDAEIWSDDTDLAIGSFFSYTKKEAPTELHQDEFYDMRVINRTTKNLSSIKTFGMTVQTAHDGSGKASKDLFNVGPDFNPNFTVTRMSGSTPLNYLGDPTNPTECNIIGGVDGYGDNLEDREGSLRLARDAKWIDMRDEVRNNRGEERIDELADFKDRHFVDESIELALLFNDNPDSDAFRTVYVIVVLDAYTDDDVTPASFTMKSVTRSSMAGVTGEAPNNKITFTAEIEQTGTVPASTRYNYAWSVKRDGTWSEVEVHESKNSLTDTFELTVSAADLALDPALEVKCTVTAKESGKVVSSSKNGTADLAVESAVEIEDTNTYAIGSKVSYRANVTVDGASVTATSYAFSFKKADGSALTTEEMTALLTALEITESDLTNDTGVLDLGTLTDAKARALAGLTVDCAATVNDEEISAGDTADSDPEVEVPTIPDYSDMEGNTAPAADETEITVTFDSTKYSVKDSEGIRLASGDTFKVTQGRDFTVKVTPLFVLNTGAPLYDFENLNDVTEDPSWTKDTETTLTFYSNKGTSSATITLSQETFDASILEGHVERANLADKKATEEGTYTSVPTDVLMPEGYTATGAANADGTAFTISFAHPSLWKHWNPSDDENSAQAYWLGFVFDAATIEGWTIQSFTVGENTYEWNGTFNNEGNGYFGHRNAPTNPAAADTFTLKLQSAKGTVVDLPVTLDMSGVTFVETTESGYVAPTPAP